MRLFVTGTGTGVGKTWVSVALAEALVAEGHTVAAVKPLETGCEPEPTDARLLAEACGHPELSMAPGFHRGRAPLAPWAAELEGDPAAPTSTSLARAVLESTAGFDAGLAEGAGGPLVPLSAEEDVLDLIDALGWPVLLVGLDGLGTLSHSMTAYDTLTGRDLQVTGLILTRQDIEPSQRTNRTILDARLPIPVWSVGPWATSRGNAEAVRAIARTVMKLAD